MILSHFHRFCIPRYVRNGLVDKSLPTYQQAMASVVQPSRELDLCSPFHPTEIQFSPPTHSWPCPSNGHSRSHFPRSSCPSICLSPLAVRRSTQTAPSPLQPCASS